MVVFTKGPARAWRAASLCGVLALTGAAPALAQQIGTVASEAPTLQGTPPGAAARALTVGTLVVQNETIQSSGDGRGQLMFLDETTLSIGPNTTIVLDRFVFDPSDQSGEMGVRLTQGTLRFIGGVLSDDSPAVITTPSATIGIRGSTALVRHQNGETEAVFIAGDQLCADFGGGETCTSRQGGLINREGYQGQVSEEQLVSFVGSVDGEPETPSEGLGSSPPGLGTGGRDPGLPPISTGGTSFDTQLFEEDTENDEELRVVVEEMPTPAPIPMEPEPEPDTCVIDDTLDVIDICP